MSKATIDGLHIREGQMVRGMACWELWSGDVFLTAAFGAMSLAAMGALADHIHNGTVHNPGIDWVVHPDEGAIND